MCCVCASYCNLLQRRTQQVADAACEGEGFALRGCGVQAVAWAAGHWPHWHAHWPPATAHPEVGATRGFLAMRMYYLYLISYDILYLIFKFSRGDFGGHRPESHRAHSVDTERALISSVLVFRGTRRRAFF